MVIDTSAVLAWLKREPERERIVAALEAHPICRISAVSLLGTSWSVPVSIPPCPQSCSASSKIGAVVMPFDEQQARLADAAFLRYGRARAIRLNSTWATAQSMRWPRPWANRCCSWVRISARRTSHNADRLRAGVLATRNRICSSMHCTKRAANASSRNRERR